jgi:16S rRNA (cytidine1402-2'-O)-methyltransferase
LCENLSECTLKRVYTDDFSMTSTAQPTGTLFVVATPIGNMADLTPRAIETFRNTSLIACEDTRETARLLATHDIGTRTIAYHAQSAKRVEDDLLAQLMSGSQITLVCDRGTPGISDPGSRLVRRAAEAGITIVPIPGATALITALQAAGVDTSSFWFRGFIPHKKRQANVSPNNTRAS